MARDQVVHFPCETFRRKLALEVVAAEEVAEAQAMLYKAHSTEVFIVVFLLVIQSLVDEHRLVVRLFVSPINVTTWSMDTPANTHCYERKEKFYFIIFLQCRIN